MEGYWNSATTTVDPAYRTGRNFDGLFVALACDSLAWKQSHDSGVDCKAHF